MVDKIDQLHNSATIDPNGDVRLILDHGTFKVSRKALCLSSPVFLAMLRDDSRFLESSDEVACKGSIMIFLCEGTTSVQWKL